MLKVLFTLDYEIHGNGEGCPYELMVEPTARMLDLFERYGAKLTIMADVAEILKFREYKEQYGRDDYHYEAIAEQLRDAIRRGHDVQLHLHSSYFNATYKDGRWEQDWKEYNFAGLPFDRMDHMVHSGKAFLEELLRPVDPGYECFAFRAANWSVSPSTHVVRALSRNGIRIDTSVFKYGRREGVVSFDYSNAHSNLLPWPVDERDICRRDDSGMLTEVPIYCERRWIGAFLTRNRVHRALMSRAHRIPKTSTVVSQANESLGRGKHKLTESIRGLAQKHAWKADFNQCTGRQLVRALRRAVADHEYVPEDLCFVLIGHSKLFTRGNERALEPFLKHVAESPGVCGFGVFDAGTAGRAVARGC